MKKKKRSYIELVIAILIIVFALYIGSTIGFLIIIRHSTLPLVRKGYLGILLLTILTLLAIIIRKKVFLPLKKYNILSQKFISGKIHREYIDKISDIYPGLYEAMNHFDIMLAQQRINNETKKRSEFLALQNQINPHFLYNTLEAIRGDALSEGINYIADITEALSTFFRYSVTDTGSLVTLADELDNVDNYFKIQQYRFGERLKLLYELPEDEEVLELMCPKLTLQPIVENAIFHGLERRTEKGRIVIRLAVTDNKVVITIIDNGVGMDNKELELLNQRLKDVAIPHTDQEKRGKGGIAMINVCKRIKLLFGENYGIHVFSIPDFGTDVRITLPIVTKNLENDYERRITSY